MSDRAPIVGIFVALAVGVASDAAAQNARDAARQDELAKIERQLAERRREESRLKDEAARREREVRALRNSMIETANALQSAEERIADINAELARLEGDEAEAAAALTAQQNNLGDVLGGLQSLERSRPPALLVSPDDAAKAARAAMLLADAAPAIEARAAALRETIARLSSVQKALAEERADQRRTNAEIDNRRLVLSDLLKRKQAERDVAQKLAAAAQGETAALAARASTLRGVLDRLNKLARSIVPRLKPPPPRPSSPTPGATPDAPSRKSPPAGGGAPLRRGPALTFTPGTPFSSVRGKLRPPVVGELTGRFGDNRPDGASLEGLRFAAAGNAIVTAPFEASVVFARFYQPTGNLIVLDVGAGYHILLMGIGSFLVEEGQTIAAGEPIAVMPAQESQLDFEIRRNREPVNPSLWLSGKTGG